MRERTWIRQRMMNDIKERRRKRRLEREDKTKKVSGLIPSQELRVMWHIQQSMKEANRDRQS